MHCHNTLSCDVAKYNRWLVTPHCLAHSELTRLALGSWKGPLNMEQLQQNNHLLPGPGYCLGKSQMLLDSDEYGSPFIHSCIITHAPHSRERCLRITHPKFWFALPVKMTLRFIFIGSVRVCHSVPLWQTTARWGEHAKMHKG